MAPYQYSPLKEDLNEIRVLILQPGDFTADLHISIHKVGLTLDDPPIYEALSYVWGTTDNPVDIRIGPSGEDRLAITQNLAVALPYLRYQDKIRTLWIDAICVNQQDLRERSSQVKKMADIYRLADHVVVWLGTEKDNSAHILRILSQLSSEIKVDYELATMSPASSDSVPDWSDRSLPLPYSIDEICNIASLLNRAWFSRLWVWQEIRLARNNSIVICGSDTISWQSLHQAIFCFYYKQWAFDSLSPDSGQVQARLLYLLNISDDTTSYLAFGDIIRRSAPCKCSDPKDRIYAVLSLLDRSVEGINIEPDYTKTTAQVYQDVVTRHVEHHKSLGMLKYCELRNDMPAEMPTWVPNWTVADTATPLYSCGRACGHSEAKAQYREGGILSATGVISASISSADEMVFQCTYRSMADEIRRIAPRNIEDSPYPAGSSLIDAFCSTMCVNSFSDTIRPPQPVLPQFEKSREFVLAVLRDHDRHPNSTLDSDESKYLGGVASVCENRSFITTEGGYIGVAPKATKPGDQVCVLLGLPQPLVLRQTSGLRYQVVGECYVHGLMNGEAVLDPLPDNYQAILSYDQGLRGYQYAFLDKQTGNTQYYDPRTGEGGLGGQIDKESIWETLPDGSEDLVLTSDMLKRRGVKLQDFDLI
ncbi:hypothetical protein HO173_011731 [Letharia columbiana]|uniref:Heterokaryon incompatibility domain-containing protein n=1 Tax=Letharia columbiana TaxID=112416 RepID=A0A8H6FHF8_9LECA|nr:uncharacterized protein HO173_011731 [Letharia columbiana]KAF6228712.1 hypothetical protein HO173_011731 [Letharia columbiana]